jgi:two-component system cell cycle sensor histidine kinase/response regulator CckA
MATTKGGNASAGGDEAQEDARPSGMRALAEGRTLASSIGHDLNNLLTVIGANAQIARTLPGATPDIKKCLDDILGAGALAAKLTRQLLHLGRDVSALTSADINSVVMGFAGVLRGVVRAGVRTTLDLWHEPLRVRMSPTDLERILLNLAENARDAMASGGSLRIETRPFVSGPGASPYVLLVVADTGRGMDPETAARIYEPFFTTKPGKGTGLGLATVHNLVTGCSGHIHVETAVGVGTTFRLLLPQETADPSVAVGAGPGV